MTHQVPTGVAYALDAGDSSLALCRFNAKGNQLATGCHDGQLRIADLDTKAFAKDLLGHVAPIVSLSWSSNSRFLLSAAKDWNCILWDLLDPTPAALKEKVLRFSSPCVMAAMLHDPIQDSFRIVVSCLNQYPYLISMQRDQESGLYKEQRDWLINLAPGQVDLTNSPEFIQTTVVAFDTTGDYVFLGNAKGIVTVVENANRSILKHFRPSGTAAIKGFSFSSDGKFVAVNSADRSLRSYLLTTILAPPPPPAASTAMDEDTEHAAATPPKSALQVTGAGVEIQTIEADIKYFDSVDQNRWVQCVFSPDSKYFIGGSAVKNSHKVYIWDRETANLVKLLEIQKDSLLDIAWHPRLPILVSISTASVLNVWTVKVHENWSAFAPDFKELDENVEYIEMEDEFDIVEDSQKRSLAVSKAAEEDEYVDVIGE
ncbi:hypothetical protein HDU98_011352 [Podochytrium sp. JEL0797]|nr:hypothetical protein HDU98_011352 [Podochytrium sp. JEL0797]